LQKLAELKEEGVERGRERQDDLKPQVCVRRKCGNFQVHGKKRAERQRCAKTKMKADRDAVTERNGKRRIIW